MRKNIKTIKKGAAAFQKVTGIGIRTFHEQPNIERAAKENQTTGKLQASDLFSLFTADIIREQKLFTR